MRTKHIIGFIFFILLVLAGGAQNMPQLKIFPTSKFNCINSSITFSSSFIEDGPVFANPPDPTVYSWTIVPNNGLSQASGFNNTSISLTFTSATTFSLLLLVTRGEFAIPASTVISIGGFPKASFNATFLDVGYPNQLQLTNFSKNNFINRWIYSDTPKVDSTLHTIKNYTTSGAYSVMLIVGGQTGCTDTARYSFYLVDTSGITLPNIFSPNGDGVNDTYRPIARGIRLLSAKIFNRNNVMIHSWDTVGGFWDGYTNSGQPCIDGEYFIILNATGFDGKTYKLSSHITLLR